MADSFFGALAEASIGAQQARRQRALDIAADVWKNKEYAQREEQIKNTATSLEQKNQLALMNEALKQHKQLTDETIAGLKGELAQDREDRMRREGELRDENAKRGIGIREEQVQGDLQLKGADSAIKAIDHGLPVPHLGNIGGLFGNGGMSSIFGPEGDAIAAINKKSKVATLEKTQTQTQGQIAHNKLINANISKAAAQTRLIQANIKKGELMTRAVLAHLSAQNVHLGHMDQNLADLELYRNIYHNAGGRPLNDYAEKHFDKGYNEAKSAMIAADRSENQLREQIVHFNTALAAAKSKMEKPGLNRREQELQQTAVTGIAVALADAEEKYKLAQPAAKAARKIYQEYDAMQHQLMKKTTDTLQKITPLPGMKPLDQRKLSGPMFGGKSYTVSQISKMTPEEMKREFPPHSKKFEMAKKFIQGNGQQ